jgi:hypothetical protein
MSTGTDVAQPYGHAAFVSEGQQAATNYVGMPQRVNHTWIGEQAPQIAYSTLGTGDVHGRYQSIPINHY